MMYTPTSSAMKLVISIPSRIAVTAFSSACPFISGRSTSIPAGKRAFRRCRTSFTETPGAVHQVDAIEIMPPIENHLRGINIHHRNIAAEDLAHARRLEDPLHHKILSSRAP